ncbi:MAG: cell division protein FtsQ/DivIB [Ktedonobacteraceae bacterium]
MTEEKRQLREQIATHTYRHPTASASRPAPRRKTVDEAAQRALHTQRAVAPSRLEAPRQRQVKQLDQVQPKAGEQFVHRRNQLYSARAVPQRPYTRLMPRTLAQSGVPASSGQMRSVHPLQQAQSRYHSSPIPVRSGRLQGRRSGFLWKVLGIFALLVLVILGANFALTSTAFRVAQVSVVGVHNDVLARSIQHMGMQGQNIFLIDVVALTARIDAFPMVASASLEKQWPNQLRVTVTERQPTLLWKTSQGTFSVDNNGRVIAPLSDTTGAASLMTVLDMRTSSKGAIAQAIRPGVQLNQADITFAVAALAGLSNVAGLTNFTLRYVNTAPAQLTSGQAGENGAYVVDSKSGWLAYLGGSNDPNPLHNRLIELQQILALAQQQQLKLATIDLRFGLRPVYTLKS